MARLGGPSKLGNVTKKWSLQLWNDAKEASFFLLRSQLANSQSSITRRSCEELWYTFAWLWKSKNGSFFFLSSSKAEKNSALWPSKKAIFSRQINPRRLGKPNGVHHELSRNRATGCSSKFLILQSSVFCPKLAWTPCRWSIGASVWDTWGVVGEVGIPRPGITERAYASLASLQTVIFASKVTPICTVMSNAGNKLASQAFSVHKIKMHICKRVT